MSSRRDPGNRSAKRKSNSSSGRGSGSGSGRSGGRGRGRSGRGGRGGRGGGRGGGRSSGRSGGRSGKNASPNGQRVRGQPSIKPRKNHQKRASKKAPKKKVKRPSALKKLGKKIKKLLCPCLRQPVELDMSSTSKSAAKAVGFTEADCIKIKRRFDDIDFDLKGEISYGDFLEDINEARSPFTDAVFAMVDVNGNGELDFDEYIQIFLSYCMFNQDEILTFTYECFDKDGSGTIDEEEFRLLAKTVNNGAPTFPGNFGTALEEFDSNGDGLIDMDEFRELNRVYPMVLFPAFRFQDNLQKGSLGSNGWVRILKRKAKLARLEDYRENHKGQLPPVSGYIGFCSKLCPCVYEHPYNDVLEALADSSGGDPLEM